MQAMDWRIEEDLHGESGSARTMPDARSTSTATTGREAPSCTRRTTGNGLTA